MDIKRNLTPQSLVDGNVARKQYLADFFFFLPMCVLQVCHKNRFTVDIDTGLQQYADDFLIGKAEQASSMI